MVLYGNIFSQLPFFLEALGLTVLLSIFAMAVAVVWGLIILIPRKSSRPWLNVPTRAYVELMRNTPLLLQIYVVYFGLPLIGIPLSGFMCGVLGVASQHGAFLSEIYRSGIESISERQREAAKALGMTKFKMMCFVILPQAFTNIAPAMTNQLILLLKDTSLVSAIGVMEMTLTAKVVLERSAATLDIFILIGLLYLGLTSLLGGGLRLTESWQRRKL